MQVVTWYVYVISSKSNCQQKIIQCMAVFFYKFLLRQIFLYPLSPSSNRTFRSKKWTPQNKQVGSTYIVIVRLYLNEEDKNVPKKPEYLKSRIATLTKHVPALGLSRKQLHFMTQSVNDVTSEYYGSVESYQWLLHTVNLPISGY